MGDGGVLGFCIINLFLFFGRKCGGESERRGEVGKTNESKSGGG